jgi:hypothetical protein
MYNFATPPTFFEENFSSKYDFLSIPKQKQEPKFTSPHFSGVSARKGEIYYLQKSRENFSP